MPCYHPIRAFKPEPGSVSRQLIFSKLELAHLEPIKVPCGQCIGCRLERSRQWAVRCVHEASMYERNSFITLTYDDDHLPTSGTLVKADFQKFMKRLRKAFPNDRIRYFHCGEYGEVCATCGKSRRYCSLQKEHKYEPSIGRPHYHACLFNFDFRDRRLWSVRKGVKLYTSERLGDLWSGGFSTVGDVTFESAAYVARYITKKITGRDAESHYEKADLRTGEFTGILPEYVTMSRRPGIGRPWLDKYLSDVYPHDRVVLPRKDGPMLVRPPKYYDGVFQLEDPFAMEEIKWRREQARRLNLEECSFERLRVRERHQLIRFTKLIRGYETDA